MPLDNKAYSKFLVFLCYYLTCKQQHLNTNKNAQEKRREGTCSSLQLFLIASNRSCLPFELPFFSFFCLLLHSHIVLLLFFFFYIRWWLLLWWWWYLIFYYIFIIIIIIIVIKKSLYLWIELLLLLVKKNFLKKFLIQSKYKKTRRILRVIDRDKHKL